MSSLLIILSVLLLIIFLLLVLVSAETLSPTLINFAVPWPHSQNPSIYTLIYFYWPYWLKFIWSTWALICLFKVAAKANHGVWIQPLSIHHCSGSRWWIFLQWWISMYPLDSCMSLLFWRECRHPLIQQYTLIRSQRAVWSCPLFKSILDQQMFFTNSVFRMDSRCIQDKSIWMSHQWNRSCISPGADPLCVLPFRPGISSILRSAFFKDLAIFSHFPIKHLSKRIRLHVWYCTLSKGMSSFSCPDSDWLQQQFSKSHLTTLVDGRYVLHLTSLHPNETPFALIKSETPLHHFWMQSLLQGWNLIRSTPCILCCSIWGT